MDKISSSVRRTTNKRRSTPAVEPPSFLPPSIIMVIYIPVLQVGGVDILPSLQNVIAVHAQLILQLRDLRFRVAAISVNIDIEFLPAVLRFRCLSSASQPEQPRAIADVIESRLPLLS